MIIVAMRWLIYVMRRLVDMRLIAYPLTVTVQKCMYSIIVLFESVNNIFLFYSIHDHVQLFSAYCWELSSSTKITDM